MIRPGVRRSRVWHSVRILAAGFLVLALFLIPVISLAEISEPDSGESDRLQLVSWEASFLGNLQPGVACWVLSAEGALRLEVLPGAHENSHLSDLLEQEGEGFTLILGTGLSGTFNPWRQEWRSVDAAAAGWVRLVAGVLTGQDPRQVVRDQEGRLLEQGLANHAPPVPRFFHGLSDPSQPSRLRVQLPALDNLAGPGVSLPDERRGGTISRFRQRMTFRGDGRGGDEEILTMAAVSWRGKTAWSLNSSRKPGRLLVSTPEPWAISSPGPEAFAPLWPLVDLVDLGEKIRELR
jgi:hypothetical protein